MRSRKIGRQWLRAVIMTAMVVLIASLGPPQHSATSPATVRYVIDTPRSKFNARAFAGGLLWFKGHDHHLVAREFSGEVDLTPDSITPASLHLVVKAGSLVETGEAFTEPQKEIINKELREIVLHPDKYPDITFQSTSVKSKPAEGGGYDVEIRGKLTLHGVTRNEEIHAHVTLQGNEMRAVGDFTIDRGGYGVKATSAFHGLVRVRDTVKFTFDIVAVK
ncbi:MAG TPA: YceI family protein [Pyrinomonadaceae bacterium]|nr:YceI family protein [Pyrinomonadaceae bacterium]